MYSFMQTLLRKVHCSEERKKQEASVDFSRNWCFLYDAMHLSNYLKKTNVKHGTYFFLRERESDSKWREGLTSAYLRCSSRSSWRSGSQKTDVWRYSASRRQLKNTAASTLAGENKTPLIPLKSNKIKSSLSACPLQRVSASWPSRVQLWLWNSASWLFKARLPLRGRLCCSAQPSTDASFLCAHFTVYV